MRREIFDGVPGAGHSGVTTHLMQDAVLDSGHAVLLLQAPAERILAASPAAREVLAAADEGDLVGRLLSEMTETRPTEGAEVPLLDRLNGYETHRTLRGGAPDRQLDIWFRTVSSRTDEALVVALMSQPVASWNRPADPGTEAASGPDSVIGAVDSQLMLDRVSDNIETFLGHPPEDVLGQSLLHLIVPDDVPDLLYALARATGTQAGVGLEIRMLGPRLREQRFQLMLQPLHPVPSCAFALQPTSELADTLDSAEDFTRMIGRLGRGIQAAVTARELTDSRIQRGRPLAELTLRESQIVIRLIAGDRVPAIAQQLFLAQSTVRNHLSAVFSKLGVRSQQELIVLMRQAQNVPSDR